MFVCIFICISFHVLCLLVPKSLLLLSYQMILIALNRRQKANIQIIVLSVMADELYYFFQYIQMDAYIPDIDKMEFSSCNVVY